MKPAYTLSRSVTALVAVGTILTIAVLASILAANMQTTVKARIHEYKRDDGQVNRVVDPWRPLPGCIFLQSSQGKVLWPLDGKNSYRLAMIRLCRPAPWVLPEHAVSPALHQLMLAANNQWRAPLQQNALLPMNRIERDGMIIPQGAHINLTLDAVLQTAAQKIADCMTGLPSSCAGAGVAENTWAKNSEGAAARMFGVVLLDVETGAILALASSHSECYQKEHSGEALPDHCPTPALMRESPLPGKLDFHAFAGASPGSLVKPIMALAFMRDPVLGPKLRLPGSVARNVLLEDFKHSDSPNFLDRAYCKELGFVNCTRMQGIADAAHDLGWNAPEKNVFALAGPDAAKQSMRLVTPHFLQTVNKQWQWTALPVKYAPGQAMRCALLKWHKCAGEVANTASELIGQGNAVASPLSIAGMFRKIALAANGENAELPTHLLQSVVGQLHGKDATLPADASPSPLRIDKDAASLILEGMARTHHGAIAGSKQGTAHSACLSAYGGGRLAQQACEKLRGVAGKTGTPSFAHESITWRKRAVVCADLQLQRKQAGLSLKQRLALDEKKAHCTHSAVKWYAAALRADPAGDKGPYTKILVVLAERAYTDEGKIQSQNDDGANVAAELAFRLIKNTATIQ